MVLDRARQISEGYRHSSKKRFGAMIMAPYPSSATSDAAVATVWACDVQRLDEMRGWLVQVQSKCLDYVIVG